MPIVAIDPEDARDHDDAIWAEADGEGRLERDRRDRRRQLLRPPGIRARPRGAGARQQRLFPRPRRADAARGAVGGHLLAQGRARTGPRWPATSRSRKDGTLKSWRFTRAKIRIAANIAYEDAQAAIDAADEERIEVSSPTCSMPDVEGAVPRELVEKALKPLWACWRALFAARQQARSARARPPRAARDARREGPHRLDRAARPARRAPAGRGLHDRSQRRCRARARGQEGAGHVPRP